MNPELSRFKGDGIKKVALVNLLLTKSTDPSFPADHAAFVFGIAWLLPFKDRKIGAFALGLARKRHH